MDITTTDKNLSTIFLLPMLYDKLDKQSISYLNKYVTNCYVRINNKPELDNNLVLFFDGVNGTVAATLWLILKPHVTWHDYTSKKAVFSLIRDTSYDEWYNLFIQGKYSLFEPRMKLLIVKYWLLDNTSTTWSVLFRTNLIKQWWINEGVNIKRWSEDADYWHRPNLNTELLHL
jgi:L-rhamnose mutarotase